jgi:hypothetical protein
MGKGAGNLGENQKIATSVQRGDGNATDSGMSGWERIRDQGGLKRDKQANTCWGIASVLRKSLEGRREDAL